MKNFFACVAFVLAFIVTAQSKADEQDVYRNNIVIVFDASGSMDEEFRSEQGSVRKIDAAKQALTRVLGKVKSNTNIGLFVFGNINNHNPYPLGPADLKVLNEIIWSINTGGGTPLGEYIKKGADQLLAQRQSQLGYGSYKLLVVTDGEATDGDYMQKVAPEVLKRGISLDVIGVGMNATHKLATMSSSYRSANNPKALDKALSEIIAETSSTGSSSNDDDFSAISGLTDEQAKTIISNLYNTENQPLFEQPKPLSSPVLNMIAKPAAPVANSGVGLLEVFLIVIVVLLLVVFGILICNE